MTNDQIQLQAQVDTLQYMLQRAYALFYIGSGHTAEKIKAGHAEIKTVFLTQGFGSDDPATSALISGALEDALSEFLSGTEQITEHLRPKKNS